LKNLENFKRTNIKTQFNSEIHFIVIKLKIPYYPKFCWNLTLLNKIAIKIESDPCNFSRNTHGIDIKGRLL